jgi:gliding motility-associated-like protein
MTFTATATSMTLNVSAPDITGGDYFDPAAYYALLDGFSISTTGSCATTSTTICDGDNITESASGYTTDPGYEQLYVLVNTTTGNIVATNTTGTFTQADYGAGNIGDYEVYAVNTNDASVIAEMNGTGSWATAQTNAAPLCAGIMGPQIYIIENCCDLVVTTSITNETCDGTNDGAIDFTIAGSGTYDIIIGGNVEFDDVTAGTHNWTGQSDGTFSVQIVDINDATCDTIFNITVGQGLAQTTPTFDPVADICSGDALAALPTISTNGISGTWSPALNNTATTTYTFAPATGQCATTTTLTITVNSCVATTICDGDNISESASGFETAPGYEQLYVLVNTTTGNIVATNTTGTFTQADYGAGNIGDYDVYAVNTNDATIIAEMNGTGSWTTAQTNALLLCADIIGPQIYIIENCCDLDVTTIVTDETCDGLADGSIDFTVNGSGTYDIIIDGNVEFNDITASTQSWSALADGTYSVQVIDINDATCDTTFNITVGQGPAQTTPTFDPVADICSGDALAALPTTSTNGITGTWSPALDNTATTTYTFTPTAGQCATTTTLTITVNPNVTPTFDPVAAICIGDVLAPLSTTSTNGITGTWSPALDNTTTTTYTFTPDAGQCATTTTLTITVGSSITPTFDPVAAICEGDALTALSTTSTNGITGTWSPALDNTITTTYTFTPTAGQCATNTTLTITVNPNVTPTFDPVAAICEGDALAALPTTSTNGITGTWSPALDNTATTTYTFTPTAGQCATTTTLTITVNPNVTPTFNAVADICSGDVLSPLPTVSTNGISGTWSPALDNTTTTTYTFTPDAGQCATTTTLTIIVNPLPTFTVVTTNPTSCLVNDGTITISGLNGNTVYLLNDGSGVLTMPSDPFGEILLTGYGPTSIGSITIEDQNTGCTTVDNTGWTLTAPSAPTVTVNSDQTICQGDNVTLSSTISGGTVSWVDDFAVTYTEGDVVSPSVTTVYTATVAENGCNTTASFTVTVNPNVTPTFDPVAAICSGDALSALPIVSTNGITGTWSPALDNSTTTTYTFTPDAGQCATTTTLAITVNPNITPTFDPVAAICIGDVLAPLPTTSTNGIAGTWSPALNNTATTTYTFTPDAGQCATTTTLTITVGSSITPTFDPVADICSGDALTPLATTSTNGITGTWSPALDNTTTTTYTFTPDAGQCAVTTTLTITVNSNVMPTFDPVAAICSGDVLSPLPTTSTNGITGTWSPALDNTTTTTYTFTPDVGQCATTTTLTITVNPATTPTFDPVAAICSGEALSPLPTTSTNGITGTWSPALDNTTTTTYTFTPDAGQCATTTTLTITVNPLPVITAEALTDITDCLNPNGSITITANGTGYELFDASNNSVSTNTTGIFNNLNAGDYYVEVTLNGCVSTSSINTVNNALAPAAPAAGTDATYCDGDVIADLTATAGAGGTLTWYDDAPLTNNIGTGSPFTPNNTIGTTTYYVTETASNCESPATAITITINAVPSAPIAGTDATYCLGDALADLTTTATSPNWYSDAGLNTNIGSNSTLTPNNTVGTTTYYVTESNNGCESPASTVTVTINDAPSITAEVATDLTDCQTPNGTVTITSNGTNYELFDASNNSIATNTTGNFTNLTAGDYYVVVSNGNCTTTGAILTISDQTQNSSNTLNATVCSGESYFFADGTDQIITSNQTYVSTLTNAVGCDSVVTENIIVAQPSVGVYYDTICEGDDYFSQIDNGGFVNVLQSFSYTATLDQPTNANGCDSIVTEFITVIPAPTLHFGMDIIVCEGEEVTIDLTTNSGQTPDWTNGYSGLSTTFIATNDTTFVAEITTSCGTVTDTINVIVTPGPTVDAGSDQTIPLGATVDLEATGAMSYIWEPGHLVDCHDCAFTTAATTATTIFVVTGTDENGCQDTDTVIVNIDGEITIYIPNIFSPNGDGENDFFQVYGSDWREYRMEIYNRWGGLIFESEDPNINWDGKHYKNGEDCPQAVFVYKFWGVSTVGMTFERAGNVMLTR